MGLAAKRSSAMRARDASVPPTVHRTGQSPCASELAGRSAPVHGSPSHLDEYVCASHRCPATVGPSSSLAHNNISGVDGAANAASIVYTSAATQRKAFKVRKRSRKGSIFSLPRWVLLSVLLGCTAMVGPASSAEQQLACTSDQGLHYITGPANDDVSNRACSLSIFFFFPFFFFFFPPPSSSPLFLALLAPVARGARMHTCCYRQL